MPPHTSHASQQRQQRLQLATNENAAAASDPSASQSDALVPNPEAKSSQSQSLGPVNGRSYGPYGSSGYGAGTYGSSGMYGSYGGYGSSMYGGYPRYGMGGYGMGGYGSYGMYGGYGMGGGYGGYGMMGMDGAGSGWLFNLHLLLASMGQLTELIGMNTQALQYFFGNVVGLVDGALQLLSPSPPELLEDAEIREDDDERVKRHKIQQQRRERELKRLKFIRWAVILLAAFATYRTVKNMLQRGAQSLLTRPRISYGASSSSLLSPRNTGVSNQGSGSGLLSNLYERTANSISNGLGDVWK